MIYSVGTGPLHLAERWSSSSHARQCYLPADCHLSRLLKAFSPLLSKLQENTEGLNCLSEGIFLRLLQRKYASLPATPISNLGVSLQFGLSGERGFIAAVGTHLFLFPLWTGRNPTAVLLTLDYKFTMNLEVLILCSFILKMSRCKLRVTAFQSTYA